MRRPLDDGWSIELPGAWNRDRTRHGVTRWWAPGRTMHVKRAGFYCTDALGIAAWLDSELPPNPSGKVGEGGDNGVGARCAWLYRESGGVHYTLYGYNFRGCDYLETVFRSADTPDLAWAFGAWRSVAHGTVR